MIQECCRIEARIKRMNSKSQEIQEQMKEGEGETERLQNEQLVRSQHSSISTSYVLPIGNKSTSNKKR